MNGRRVVALIAVLGLVAGCTSRTGGPPEETGPAGETASPARQRDQMLEEADTIVDVLNTVDPDDVEAAYDKWESVATGDLLDEFESGREENIEAIRSAGTGSEAEVLASAAAEFAPDDGEAQVLVSVKVSVARPSMKLEQKFQRLRLTLARTDDGWKASGLEQVPVGG
jgi:Mce-associated membrane protein